MPMSGMSAKNPNQASPSASASGKKDDSGSFFDGFAVQDSGITFCEIPAQTTERTKIYKSYSLSSKVLGVAPKNTKLTVVAYNKNWAYVSKDGKKGFILLKHLKKLS